MSSIPISRPSTVALLVLVLIAGAGAARAELYARNFELQTLEPRLAVTIASDVCRQLKKSQHNCKVIPLLPSSISVFAAPEVHDAVQRTLAEKDPPVPTSLGFRVILVRPGKAERAGQPTSPDIERALAAVEELLGYSARAIQDVGVIRTGGLGSTRLAGGDDELFEVELELRSVVTRRAGQELTVELRVREAARNVRHPVFLTSVVTLALGETVVAGTSRADPDEEPLLILLTSLAESGGR